MLNTFALGFSFLLGGDTSHQVLTTNVILPPDISFTSICILKSLRYYPSIQYSPFFIWENRCNTLLLEACTSPLLSWLQYPPLKKHVPHHTSSSSSRCNMERKIVFIRVFIFFIRRRYLSQGRECKPRGCSNNSKVLLKMLSWFL